MHPLLLSKVMNEPWAILPPVHDVIAALVAGDMQARSADFAQVPFTPMAVAAGLSPPSERGSRLWTRNQLAVIPVQGVIGSHLSNLEVACGGYGVQQFSADIERAANSPAIKDVLAVFHSPGGTVTGLPEAASRFAELGATKKTYAFTDGMSASASYWLMSQASQIYVTPSGSVGSIGVFSAVVDRSKAAETAGLKVHLVTEGKYKGLGYPGTPVTDAHLAHLREETSKLDKWFKDTVRARRSRVDESALQGQMFRGQDAIRVGLADSTTKSLSALIHAIAG